jgi:hypothetical protein
VAVHVVEGVAVDLDAVSDEVGSEQAASANIIATTTAISTVPQRIVLW